MQISLDDIIKIDNELISKNILIHARPFHAALGLMELNGVYGEISKFCEATQKLYETIYPKQNFSFPTLLIGGISFRDQLYITKIPLIYGNIGKNLFEFVDIDKSELSLIHTYYNEQYRQAAYCICDLYDIAFGIDQLLKQDKDENLNYWLKMVLSSIMSTAFTLSEKINLENAIQSSLLSIELAIKSCLLYLGCDYSQIEKLGHSKLKMINKLAEYTKIKNNDHFSQLYNSLPEYVSSRYSEQSLSNLELVNLAIKSQFLVAELIREITNINIAKFNSLDSNFERPCFL